MSIKLDHPLGRKVYVNARLIDPASGLDVGGGVLTSGELIADLGPHLSAPPRRRTR